MKSHIKKFRQSATAFEKRGILPKNFKTLTIFNYRWVEYFSLKFYTRFPHTNVYNMVFEIFLFCLDLELFAKITKDLIPKHSETRFVYIFIDNSRSKQNKKQKKEIPNILLYTS